MTALPTPTRTSIDFTGLVAATAGDMTIEANERGCYCGLWTTKPEALKSQGVEPGFCGVCVKCGAPGHSRHAPNGPYSAAWCDRCFRRIARRDPLLKIAIVTTIVAVLLLWRYFA
jgi:hypothetical protein